MMEIHSEIERARADLEISLGDLQEAAKKLTPSHWKARAAESFRRHPGRILAGAVAVGFLFGLRRR